MENTSHTSPDFAGITLEKILESSNLNAALKKVESNKGAPGVDGMKTDELRQYIIDHPGELRRVLLDGTYRPKPVKRVTIPKSEPGKFRELGIPTVVGGRGGFYTNARVKIGHWRHQMHTILAHSYPSVAS